MMDKGDKAVSLFAEGYNCCQAVALAFSEEAAMDRDQLARLASSLGGGISRLREVCGAVSGMAVILGLLYGYEGPETGEVKADHYARVQQLALEFEQLHGSMVCRDLLGLGPGHSSPSPTPRSAAFYASRPCANLIRSAADLLAGYIKEHPLNGTEKSGGLI